ncbi:metal-dependent hydrolase [Haloarcula sp. CBA1130]|uniref:metal-dependent hydrolase n=1 Tax=unclassified Haloarcula TaxID=2624677 RepID=UPI001248FAB8|nr:MULTISPECIES: metal-dependent hydrolase [unclassified Haloarcula]KAA9397869.1 metal-dependent hydrolase [Haloarcula sp. CBA1129]KAA9402443.1 metal-dependent hydrolase [Haloarcula sp. CBA1130]
MVLPIEHFIIALLPIAAYAVIRDQRLPSLQLLAVAFFGSQFPDLIDKPLAHELFLIPSGRVFMHSLPFAIPLAIAVIAYGIQTERVRLAVAFAFAHLSHLVADNQQLLPPNPRVSPDLLWPLQPPVARSTIPNWAGAGSVNLHLWTAFSVTVLALAAYVLVVDLKAQFKL